MPESNFQQSSLLIIIIIIITTDTITGAVPETHRTEEGTDVVTKLNFHAQGIILKLRVTSLF